MLKQIKDTAMLTPLLLWVVWLCISVSVSVSDGEARDSLALKSQRPFKAQVDQEKQHKATAWFERTAPAGSAATPAEQLNAVLLMASCFFLLYRWKHPSQKAFKVTLPFSSLTEQFRILPNAP